jgi:hypothetical protein
MLFGVITCDAGRRWWPGTSVPSSYLGDVVSMHALPSVN